MGTPTGFLLLPPPGDDTAARVRRKLRLLALRQLLTWPARGLSAPAARGLRALQSALMPAVKRAPQLTLAAIGAPDILTQILTWRAGVRPSEPLLRELVPHLLLCLGRSGAIRHLGEAVLWDLPIDRLIDDQTLPSVARQGGGGGALTPGPASRASSVFTLAPPARALLAQPTGAELMDASGALLPLEELASTGERLLHPLTPELPARLALVDTNPLAMEEAHPDKGGNTLSLGGRPLEEWLRSLRAALSLIQSGLPGFYREMALTLERIVPVGFDAERHLSASYREAPGIVYLTLHPSPLTLAEALIHELQHAKLNALSWLDPLLHNGQTEWTSSPVRPDLRPLSGVLLAAHAFTPVAALHAGLAAAGAPEAGTAWFSRRRAEVRQANAEALQTLQRLAKPTALGAKVLAAIETLERATAVA